MNKIILLKITGVITIIFTLFHLAFPFMPEWEQSLKEMHSEMRNIFITYHYAIIAFLGISAYMLTFQAKKLVNSALKNSLMILFASLYIIRIITEFVCWKAPMPQAAIILFMCALPAAVFIYILIKK
ncbi:MAG: hypothetical protein PF517_19215 [Salinivirgaceae bacterium]|jgi:succinate dehydrogenase hydrophobic anchor subunit|nr:hypothetical protein [Salinivirgaceae bacterium]